MLSKIKRRISKYLSGPIKETDPAAAYNIWAENYDAQPDNLMLALDEALFSRFIADISFSNKIIVDVGCGTGRHWPKIFAKKPAQVTGYDVSVGMLEKLREKYPAAKTHQLKDNHLAELDSNSCDIIVSTLAIAHIEHIEDALREWCKVLKDDGDIIITDYHPIALLKGGDRVFVHEGKMIAVKNYVHPIAVILALAKKLELVVVRLEEKIIDKTMRPYYEKQNALHIYEKFEGVPIIYAVHLKKAHATA